MKPQSPTHVQISLAAAMTLGLVRGKFWRDAKLTCINLLLIYDDGCKANCSYCGLAREREDSDSFIRVNWPTYPLQTIIDAMKTCKDAHRVCISMITHRDAVRDTITIADNIRSQVNTPISGLIAPTLVNKGDLIAMKDAGIDKIGIAFDAATPAIFNQFRGEEVRGPHRWQRYWECFKDAVDVFGRGMVGSHFIVGLGETEEEMVRAFQQVRNLGGVNHLFSFYPESGTALANEVPPPIDQYRRIQLAAELIDRGISDYLHFKFDPHTGRIVNFGVSQADLDQMIDQGQAFMTRGCTGEDGCVACNRPFANSAPGPSLRNYPFSPDSEDIELIRQQMTGSWIDPMPVIPAGQSPRGIRKNPRKNNRIYFFAPTIKHFETDEFKNSREPFFVPVSITGELCALNCKYCEGVLLKGMYTARNAEALIELATMLKQNGGHGILLSGGCDTEGIVPLAPFAAALRRVKNEIGLATAVHTKLMDEPLARALAQAELDVLMIDVVGSDETMEEIYNLRGKTVAHVEQTIELAQRYQLPLSPHVVIGAHGGEIRGEARALAMLRGKKMHSLVLVLLMPLGREMGPVAVPDLTQIEALFHRARTMFPDIPLMLGCARPLGKLQRQLDSLALRAGFDGITYPSEGTVAEAENLGLRPIFSEYCCALVR